MQNVKFIELASAYIKAEKSGVSKLDAVACELASCDSYEQLAAVKQAYIELHIKANAGAKPAAAWLAEGSKAFDGGWKHPTLNRASVSFAHVCSVAAKVHGWEKPVNPKGSGRKAKEAPSQGTVSASPAAEHKAIDGSAKPVAEKPASLPLPANLHRLLESPTLARALAVWCAHPDLDASIIALLQATAPATPKPVKRGRKATPKSSRVQDAIDNMESDD